MKHSVWRAAPVIMIGLLAGCSTVQTQQGTALQEEKRSTGFMNLATRADIEVDTPKAFANVQKLIIGGFKVGFNESKKISGSSRLMGGKTTGELKLEGVDAATQQRLTDQAYEEFLTLLTAKGYEVLPRETLTASPTYTGLEEQEFPYRDDQAELFSSYGVGNYYSPAGIGPKQIFFPDEIPQSASGLSSLFKGAPSSGFSAINPRMAIQKFGEKTGIPVINVTYLVDFASGGSAGFSISQLKLGQMMSVDYGLIGLSRGMGGSFSTNNGKLKLGQPVQTDKTFATLEDQTSTTTQVVEGAVNLFFKGGILGAAGVGGDHTKAYVFHTDPQKFAEAAQDVLSKTNISLVDKMAELR